MNPGKMLIIVMVSAGLAAGGLKVWRQSQTMHRVLDSYSPQAVEMIAKSQQAVLWKLVEVSTADGHGELDAPGTPDDQSSTFAAPDGRRYEVVADQNLIGVKGFSDVRVRLVDDASYDWSAELEDRNPRWNYAIWFANDGPGEVLLFDIRDAKHASVRRQRGGPILSADPIADGLESFFKAQNLDAEPATADRDRP